MAKTIVGYGLQRYLAAHKKTKNHLKKIAKYTR